MPLGSSIHHLGNLGSLVHPACWNKWGIWISIFGTAAVIHFEWKIPSILGTVNQTGSLPPFTLAYIFWHTPKQGLHLAIIITLWSSPPFFKHSLSIPVSIPKYTWTMLAAKTITTFLHHPSLIYSIHSKLFKEVEIDRIRRDSESYFLLHEIQAVCVIFSLPSWILCLSLRVL